MKLSSRHLAAAAALVLSPIFSIGPAEAQVTVIDQAQDAVETVDAVPPAPCGTTPISIARMGWPSASILAEIHALLLNQEFGCEVRIVDGDLAATASSMGSTGQPLVAPELWINRVPDVWNAAMDAQMVRSGAPSYSEDTFEGWFMPGYLADTFSEVPAATALADALSQLDGGPVRFISCPADWGCSVINRNLVDALGLADLVEIVEPANRLEMDRLIAEAVNLREPFLFYYWQPNAVLAQLDFIPLDIGDYDEAAAQCLARRDCTTPSPSAFVPETVAIAVAETVFTERPVIASYFQRATLPLAEMNALLAQLNMGEATPDDIAARFIAEREDIWGNWVNRTTP